MPLADRAPAPSHEGFGGIATLLENIRMRASEEGTRILVFSSASTADVVARLSRGLVAEAERRGMRTLCATLTTMAGRTLLVANPDVGALVVNLETLSRDYLNAWVERAAPGAELVVVVGPPLADSIDAALLACACDGLVIVAQPEVTERAALHVAAERARIAGCRTLGVVLHGTKDRVPTWIRRLMVGSAALSATPVRPSI